MVSSRNHYHVIITHTFFYTSLLYTEMFFIISTSFTVGVTIKSQLLHKIKFCFLSIAEIEKEKKMYFRYLLDVQSICYPQIVLNNTRNLCNFDVNRFFVWGEGIY